MSIIQSLHKDFIPIKQEKEKWSQQGSYFDSNQDLLQQQNNLSYKSQSNRVDNFEKTSKQQVRLKFDYKNIFNNQIDQKNQELQSYAQKLKQFFEINRQLDDLLEKESKNVKNIHDKNETLVNDEDKNIEIHEQLMNMFTSLEFYAVQFQKNFNVLHEQYNYQNFMLKQSMEKYIENKKFPCQDCLDQEQKSIVDSHLPQIQQKKNEILEQTKDKSMDDFIKKKHKITLDKKNHRYFTPLSQQIVNKYVKGNHSMNNTLDLNQTIIDDILNKSKQNQRKDAIKIRIRQCEDIDEHKQLLIEITDEEGIKSFIQQDVVGDYEINLKYDINYQQNQRIFNVKHTKIEKLIKNESSNQNEKYEQHTENQQINKLRYERNSLMPVFDFHAQMLLKQQGQQEQEKFEIKKKISCQNCQTKQKVMLQFVNEFLKQDMQALQSCKSLGDHFALIIKQYQESENNDLFIKSKLYLYHIAMAISNYVYI